jgi:hypothetical protein
LKQLSIFFSVELPYFKKNRAKSKSLFPATSHSGQLLVGRRGGGMRIELPPPRLIALKIDSRKGGNMNKKISPEEFVRLAIQKLRNDPYKGIHSVYSGFNEAFKKYFNGEDPVEFTNGLSEDGKIVIRPMKGGVVLYLPQEAPQVKSRGEEALKKMGLT